MCRFKSAIILKDRVFIPDYDSHSDMLDELGIEDTRHNAEKLFIRAELSPENGDVFSNIDNWKFVVDQDILPDWYVKDYDKQRMIEAVKEWAKDRIHIGVDKLKINSGANHYIKDCKDVNICGSATVENIYDSATVENIYGSATVETAKGFSIIRTSPYSKFNNRDKLILLENATLKDCYEKKIYQSGDFKLVSVSNGKCE